MNRGLYSVLPTLSPDFSGVCSTLFELGGIIIIHDAGGCTGTYTGYDEPRWFDTRSRIFTSNLDDAEAVFGADDILLNKAMNADDCLDGKFFALLGSPAPAVLGTDYKALARILTKRTGKKAMAFTTKGMEYYDRGVSAALMGLAQTFLPDVRPEGPYKGVNLIGATPLDLTKQANVDAIKKIIEDAGHKIHSVWAMDSSLDEISTSLNAKCNIALTSSAIPVCRYLKEHYGMPYLVGSFSGIKPVEQFLKNLNTVVYDIDSEFEADVAKGNGPSALIIGEQVLGNSVRECLMMDFGFSDCCVMSLFHGDPSLQLKGDEFCLGEEELEQKIQSGKYDVIVCDPLIQDLDVSQNNRKYIDLPHVALSSRLGWTSEICPFGRSFYDYIDHKLREE